ncbi:hypothetical protein [Arsenicicoccus sp. oral taxon 190]|uniref:hypothetical protein n=1 Tax=Arsenicicoccus sp. oral taxon 190 TaxID=1658671 RepID=UPI0012E1D53C|nr:hypothetical protein [Arsenicicoccus sp. oral taxon 190]
MEDRRLNALDAVVRAWLETGSDPDYLARQHDTVRAAMPTLARALDDLVVELKGGGR